MNIALTALGFAPALAWLFFYLKEDIHPEPKKLIAFTFILGAAFAFLALAAELAANKTLGWIGVAALSPLSLIILAFIEELAKFEAAYIAVHKNPDFDEPIDAMIYMVVAALGFATVENLGAIHSGDPSQTALLSTIFETTTLRFVGATLLHTLASALLGYYWAKGIRAFQSRRPLIIGFLLATALHSVFNFFILNYGNFLYPLLIVLTSSFFILGDFEKLKRKAV